MWLRSARNRQTPYAAASTSSARTARSTASSRRITASRSAFPRITWGASPAGPLARAGPST